MDKDAIKKEIAFVVSEIVADIFDATFPEKRVDMMKGGLSNTGSLVIPRTKVIHLKRQKNSDYSKWLKRYKELLDKAAENILTQ